MPNTFTNIKNNSHFTPPDSWLQIKTIDMHTGGEPLRVILDGFPNLNGSSVLDYRRDCKNRYDHLRTALMFEPRGHADMYGCILTPPNDESGDFGIIFLHNEGYSTMCGHAIIAISTLAIKMNWVEVKDGENIMQIDAPCGRITSYVETKNHKIQGVRFHCVPSFVVALDRMVEVPGLGRVTYDLAYGGAFYAYVDMAKNDFNFHLTPNDYRPLILSGMDIKRSVIKQDQDIIHPFESDLSFLYGTIFIDNNVQETGADSRNVCIFAEGEVDRCPTGSGVSGRIAIHHVRNEIKAGETMTIESITGSIFKGSVIRETQFGTYPAVIPQVEGSAYITGMNTFVIDPEDPMKDGFILR